MTEAKTATAQFDNLLTVSKVGNGSVVSTPTGIDCGTDCTESYAVNTTVTLNATPDTGYRLSSWSGCTSSSGNTCTVNLSASKTVTATFKPLYTLTVSKDGTGSGTVTSVPTGINCGTDCTEDYISGAVVTLTAKATTGSSFAGWSGACTGTSTCKVTLSAAQTVTATFNAP